MISKKLQKLETLCREYYPSSPEPLVSFCSTLPKKDREILSKLLQGENPAGAIETLVRCEQILSVRKKRPDNPYGKYHKA